MLNYLKTELSDLVGLSKDALHVHLGLMVFLLAMDNLGYEITALLADTPRRRAYGLMYRRRLAQNRGMAFLWVEDTSGGFWMKNTLVPLDNWFETTSTAFSNYHGLLTRFEKRFSGGLTFTNSFTWSKAISDAQPFQGGNNDTGNRIQNIFDTEADWGLAPNHHKYRLVSSFLYDLPFGRGRRFGTNVSGFMDHLVGNWQINGI